MHDKAKTKQGHAKHGSKLDMQLNKLKVCIKQENKLKLKTFQK